MQGVGFDLLIVCGFAFDPHVSEEVRDTGRRAIALVEESLISEGKSC